MIRRLQYIISQDDHGKRINLFLKERNYSTTLINTLKQSELGIQRNGVRAFTNERLQLGDQLEICIEEHAPAAGITPYEYPLQVLYEDEDILVINKPHNMPIHPSINHYDNTLANAVAHYCKEKQENYVFRCINRLDRDTTGATIIAKHALSAGILSDQVKERKIHRTYVALVEGNVKEQGIVDLPIGRKEGSVIERQVDHENGKRAVTHFKKIQTIKVNDKQVSKIQLKLETGRTHQIRVHMSYMNHPLLGDFLYNEGCNLMNRQALHSAKLVFEHPITGEVIDIVAELPEDMKQIMELSESEEIA